MPLPAIAAPLVWGALRVAPWAVRAAPGIAAALLPGAPPHLSPGVGLARQARHGARSLGTQMFLQNSRISFAPEHRIASMRALRELSQRHGWIPIGTQHALGLGGGFRKKWVPSLGDTFSMVKPRPHDPGLLGYFRGVTRTPRRWDSRIELGYKEGPYMTARRATGELEYLPPIQGALFPGASARAFPSYVRRLGKRDISRYEEASNLRRQMMARTTRARSAIQGLGYSGQ